MGKPTMMTGTDMPAIKLMTMGAPRAEPMRHKIFFLRDHLFLPQNVQPDGDK